MKTIRDFNLRDKRVLVRCDFNVPLNGKGDILDDFRIKKTIPTIEYLVEKKAKVLLMSHLGRPGGRVVENLKLDRIQEKLLEYLDLSVAKAPNCVGKEIEDWSKEMAPGEILLLENLRFYKEEKENNEKFARSLAKLGDIYINEAFSCSHRVHASIVGVPKYLPSGAGLLLEKEIDALSRLLRKIERPLIAIIGGIKFQTKIGAIEYFCKNADFTLLGGHIANLLLKAKGVTMGEVIPDGIMVKEIKETVLFETEVHLPIDFVTWPDGEIRKIGEISQKERALDIGPKTIEDFSTIIKKAKTVFWNGPMGVYEKAPFGKGTKKIGEAIFKNKEAFEVVGGGDTVAAISKFDFRERFDHVSTGGGAMLDFLAGKKLPGLAALK